MDYVVEMTLSFRTTVIVEAADKEEAREKALAVEFEDDGMSGASLIDWEVHGAPRAA